MPLIPGDAEFKQQEKSLRPEDALLIAGDMLVRCESLTAVHLNKNKLGPTGAKALASVLRDCYNLSSLELASNQMGDEGIKAIAEVAMHGESIVQLDLSSNAGGRVAAEALGALLAACGELRSLVVSSNLFGDDGFKMLCAPAEAGLDCRCPLATACNVHHCCSEQRVRK